MNKYNFDEITNRYDSNSLKWDYGKEKLPMWVADMDFKTCPDVIKAINKKAKIGIYGYTIVPDDYFLSYAKWFKRRHHVNYKTEWMIYCNGVVASISSIVRKLTTAGENVLVMPPVYNIFYNSILNNGRKVVSSDLVYKNNEYFIDFSDLENKMKDSQTNLLILCNPHNPIGKNWSKEELIKISKLAKKYNVYVISDEIHCDINKNSEDFVPFLGVSKEAKEMGIACLAMSKAFNIAGLQSACIVVPNEFTRFKVYRQINTDECGEPNFFAVEANIAALTKGEEWLNQLNEYIYRNKEYFYNEIRKQLPYLNINLNDATYLMWIDCSKITDDSKTLVKFIEEDSGLILNDGEEYGINGKTFIRINLATQFERVKDGTNRFINSIKNYTKINHIDL